MTDRDPAADLAAREALASVRDLHQPDTELEGPAGPYCATCVRPYATAGLSWIHQPWPCDTARRVFTADELASKLAGDQL